MTLANTDLLAGIDQDALYALVEGRHGDPFSVLGLHGLGNGCVIRAFLPGAVSVDVLAAGSGEVLTQMQPVFQNGLFAGAVEGRPDYRLRIHWPEAIQESED